MIKKLNQYIKENYMSSDDDTPKTKPSTEYLKKVEYYLGEDSRKYIDLTNPEILEFIITSEEDGRTPFMCVYILEKDLKTIKSYSEKPLKPRIKDLKPRPETLIDDKEEEKEDFSKYDDWERDPFESLTKKYNDFLNEKIEGVTKNKDGSITYRGESFPGYNKPKKYNGKGKFKKRVLAKEGDEIKIINYGHSDYEDYTKHKDPERRKNFRKRHKCDPVKNLSKLTKKYWACQDLW